MKKRIVNLTPHTITINVGGDEATFPASGTVARVNTHAVPLPPLQVSDEPLFDIPVVLHRHGEIENLPASDEETVYIVSAPVLAALKPGERPDVVAPDTGPESAIRDEAGRIVAVRQFVRR